MAVFLGKFWSVFVEATHNYAKHLAVQYITGIVKIYPMPVHRNQTPEDGGCDVTWYPASLLQERYQQFPNRNCGKKTFCTGLKKPPKICFVFSFNISSSNVENKGYLSSHCRCLCRKWQVLYLQGRLWQSTEQPLWLWLGLWLFSILALVLIMGWGEKGFRNKSG